MIPAFFDWDTNRIGPYIIDPMYTYSETSHQELDVPIKRHLYKELAENKDALAVFFVNNAYVCCLKSNGSYHYHSLFDNLLYLSNKGFHSTLEETLIPCGFVRTAYKCQSVRMPLARVLYSKKKRALSIFDEWIPFNEEIDESAEIKNNLYGQLIKRGNDYCVCGKEHIVWKDF